MATDLRFAKRQVISLLIEKVIASQARFCSVGLVSNWFHQKYLKSEGMFGFDVLVVKYFEVDMPSYFLAAMIQRILLSLSSQPRLSL
jgi:hypothetical protein